RLTTGIIGLTNKGQPRKPDQWGALRAWGWGVSRLIDYFEQDRTSGVDPKKVGIAGLSRYGKAAIVAEAFDTRVAVGLIGSSGEGGTKLHRHIFGEAVENLAGGEYYWMAGNFIKYGASDPPKTAADLPVDSHELIALCAPRPCFISHGIVDRGDAKWIDARSSFIAAVLVRRLLRRGFDHPSLGRQRPAVCGVARQLALELLRLECGGLRVGRRPDREYPLAAGERRAGRSNPQGHCGARRHQRRPRPP